MTFVEEPFADLAGNVGLGPPDQPTVGDLVDDLVGGLGGEAQEGHLVGVLDDPQVAQDERRGLEHHRGEGGLEPQEVESPEPVRRTEAADGSREKVPHDGHRVLGLLPRGDRDVAARGGRAQSRRRDLQARHDERDGPLGRDHEHRQALQRHGAVAGQVDQVRADAHEQGIEPAGSRAGLGAGDPLGEARSGNGRPAAAGDERGAHARGASAGPAGAGTASVPGAGTGTPSQAASAAWPSSNSFRYE